MMGRSYRVWFPALLAAFALTACSTTPEPQALGPTAQVTVEPTDVVAPVPTSDGARIVNGRLVASARAVPVYNVELGFERSGVVSEILVEPGQQVRANQPIVRLDSEDAKLDVERSRVNLELARAEYKRLLAGATPEEIQSAEAQVQRVRAELLATQGQVTDADIAAARESYEQAKSLLEQLLSGPRPELVELAKANLEEARAELESVRSRLASDKEIAKTALLIAANDLRNKQDFYQKVYWDNQARGDNVSPEDRLLEDRALRDVQDAQVIVNQREVSYEEIRQVEITTLEAREAAVRAAAAKLADLFASIEEAEIIAARARVAASKADLERLQGLRREGDIKSAEALVASTEANLANLVANPRAEDLALAEVRVQQAEVALQQVQLGLREFELRAPQNATVVRMDVVVGQAIEANQTILLLADFSSWQIQTANLSELNVVSVREGDTARISFFALPDLQLTGTVLRIDPQGVDDRTVGVTYIVTVVPERWDERIRWNMSASVEIVPAGS